MSLKIPAPQTRLTLLITILVTIVGYWYYYQDSYQRIEVVYSQLSQTGTKTYTLFGGNTPSPEFVLEMSSIYIPKTLSSLNAQPLWFELIYPMQPTETNFITHTIEVQVIVSPVVTNTHGITKEVPIVYSCKSQFDYQKNCYEHQNTFEFNIKPHQKIKQPVWLTVLPNNTYDQTVDWKVDYKIDVYARYAGNPANPWFYDDVDFKNPPESSINLQKSAVNGLVYFLLTPPWANGFIPVLALAIVYFLEGIPNIKKTKPELPDILSNIFFGLVLLIGSLSSLVFVLEISLSRLSGDTSDTWWLWALCLFFLVISLIALVFWIPSPSKDNPHDFWESQFNRLIARLDLAEIRRDIKDYQSTAKELAQQFARQSTAQEQQSQKTQKSIQQLQQTLKDDLKSQQVQLTNMLQSNKEYAQTLENISKEIAQSLSHLKTDREQNREQTQEQAQQRKTALQSRINSLRQQRDKEKLDRLIEQIILSMPLDQALLSQTEHAMTYIEFSNRLDSTIKSLRTAEDETKYASIIQNIRGVLNTYSQFNEEPEYKLAENTIEQSNGILQHLQSLAALDLNDLTKVRTELPDILEHLKTNAQLQPVNFLKKYRESLNFSNKLIAIEDNFKQSKFPEIRKQIDEYIYNSLDMPFAMQNLLDFYRQLAAWAIDAEKILESPSTIECQKLIQTYETLPSKEENLGFGKRIPHSIEQLRQKLNACLANS